MNTKTLSTFFMGMCGAAVLPLLAVRPAAAQDSAPGNLDSGRRALFQSKSLGGREGLTTTAKERNSLILSPGTIMFDGTADNANLNFRDVQSMRSLMILRESTRFGMDPDFGDRDRDTQLAKRALSLQLVKSFHEVLRSSELREAYQGIYRQVRSVQDFFRYGLNRNADGGMSFGAKGSHGKRLMEFNIGTNVRDGISPQIRFGDAFRVRQDMSGGLTIVEWGIDF